MLAETWTSSDERRALGNRHGRPIFFTLQGTAVAGLSAPKLTTIGAELAIIANDSLKDLSFPVLRTVGGNFTINFNSILANSSANAILNQLVGFTGTSLVGGGLWNERYRGTSR